MRAQTTTWAQSICGKKQPDYYKVDSLIMHALCFVLT